MGKCDKPCRQTLVCPSCRGLQETENALRAARDEGALDFVARAVRERDDMRAGLASTQARCTELLNKARAWRLRIIELGGEDPGSP